MTEKGVKEAKKEGPLKYFKKSTFIKCLLCVRDCSNHLSDRNCFVPCDSPIRCISQTLNVLGEETKSQKG